jgi:fructose-1,6-bisphosphatase/inositol monophosphatase family enzyme
MTPDALLELFDATALAVREAVAGVAADARRERTGRPGQYFLDVVADAAAVKVLREAPVRIVSEESGAHGRDTAEITVVLDPVDGSTNCARGIPYWSTSLCALDADGALAALVVNQATGSRTVAVRGEGARRDGIPLRAATTEHVEDAVIAIAGLPPRPLPWKQFRALGCASLVLCDIAAGGIDGAVDGGPWHAPWDYLGGYLACIEAGAVVRDAKGADLVVDDFDARRQIVAAATPALADALMPR